MHIETYDNLGSCNVLPTWLQKLLDDFYSWTCGTDSDLSKQGYVKYKNAVRRNSKRLGLPNSIMSEEDYLLDCYCELKNISLRLRRFNVNFPNSDHPAGSTIITCAFPSESDKTMTLLKLPQ